ncbi:MAG: DUF2202 domain-containing protein [Eubacteriales bacterium]
MKRIIIIAAALVLAMALVGCTQDSKSTEEQNVAAAEAAKDMGEYDFGAKTALGMDELTIEQMLHYAIQDEYLARQEYEMIMDEYGNQRPFSNIIKAEENHIIWLKELYDAYGYDTPEDNAMDYAVLPDSLSEAFDVGVQAEIDNIAMYEKFLEDDLPDDIKAVFMELRDASKNHLASFEKGERGNGQGAGQGANN